MLTTWRELSDKARNAGRISEVIVECLSRDTISVFVVVPPTGTTGYWFQEDLPASEFAAIEADVRAGLLPSPEIAD